MSDSEEIKALYKICKALNKRIDINTEMIKVLIKIIDEDSNLKIDKLLFKKKVKHYLQ